MNRMLVAALLALSLSSPALADETLPMSQLITDGAVHYLHDPGAVASGAAVTGEVIDGGLYTSCQATFSNGAGASRTFVATCLDKSGVAQYTPISTTVAASTKVFAYIGSDAPFDPDTSSTSGLASTAVYFQGPPCPRLQWSAAAVSGPAQLVAACRGGGRSGRR